MRKLTSFDLVGKTYNGLTIKSFNSSNHKGRDLYNCLCVCGKTVILVGVDVRNNKHRTCGCNTKYTTFLDKKFGYLEVVDCTNNIRTDRLLVKCVCGVEFETNSSQLRNGYLTSCGCKPETNSKVRREESFVIDLSKLEETLNNKVSSYILQCSRNLNKLKRSDITFIAQDRLFDIENGLVGVTKKELNLLLDLYKVNISTFDKILETTKDSLRKRIKEIGMDTKMTLPELIDALIINSFNKRKTK